MAQAVKADLTVAFQSDAVIRDKKGTIMYLANQTSIGKNVFSPSDKSYVYSLAAPESKGAIDSLLAELAESRAGSQDVKFQQTVYTLSYSPVRVEGENFLMLYVILPHTLTTEVNSLVDQQRTASVIFIAAIGAVAIGVGFLIVSWNPGFLRRLKRGQENSRLNSMYQGQSLRPMGAKSGRRTIQMEGELPLHSHCP